MEPANSKGKEKRELFFGIGMTYHSTWRTLLVRPRYPVLHRGLPDIKSGLALVTVLYSQKVEVL